MSNQVITRNLTSSNISSTRPLIPDSRRYQLRDGPLLGFEVSIDPTKNTYVSMIWM